MPDQKDKQQPKREPMIFDPKVDRIIASFESTSDPLGSYTGNPIGGGAMAQPTQDADDL